MTDQMLAELSSWGPYHSAPAEGNVPALGWEQFEALPTGQPSHQHGHSHFYPSFYAPSPRSSFTYEKKPLPYYKMQEPSRRREDGPHYPMLLQAIELPYDAMYGRPLAPHPQLAPSLHYERYQINTSSSHGGEDYEDGSHDPESAVRESAEEGDFHSAQLDAPLLNGSADLQREIQGTKYFVCPVASCSNKYRHKGDLKTHVTLKHPQHLSLPSLISKPKSSKESKRFVCPIQTCKCGYKAKRDLLRHLKKKHPEEDENYRHLFVLPSRFRAANRR